MGVLKFNVDGAARGNQGWMVLAEFSEIKNERCCICSQSMWM